MDNEKGKRPMTWVLWTSAEGLTRTGTKILLKVLGLAETALSASVLATVIIGAVQTVGGFVGGTLRGKPFFGPQGHAVGGCAFGVLAYVTTVLSFMVFSYGGDMGVNTFITTLSIIPGGILGSIIFGDRLFLRQWCAMALAILAGYLVIGSPSLEEAVHLPLWVWLSFITMLTIAINQVIVQKIKDIDPMVQNFWSGAVQLVLGVLTIVAVGGMSIFTSSAPPLSFWLLSGLIGAINIAMMVFGLISYKLGASIALKKLVMFGVHLSTAMVLGVILFNESASWEKFAGVALYLAAYAAWDNDTWRSLRGT